jgi:hypothetical protein
MLLQGMAAVIAHYEAQTSARATLTAPVPAVPPVRTDLPAQQPQPSAPAVPAACLLQSSQSYQSAPEEPEESSALEEPTAFINPIEEHDSRLPSMSQDARSPDNVPLGAQMSTLSRQPQAQAIPVPSPPRVPSPRVPSPLADSTNENHGLGGSASIRKRRWPGLSKHAAGKPMRSGIKGLGKGGAQASGLFR